MTVRKTTSPKRNIEGQDQQHTERLALYVRPMIKEVLIAYAAAQNRSVANAAEFLIEQALAEYLTQEGSIENDQRRFYTENRRIVFWPLNEDGELVPEGI